MVLARANFEISNDKDLKRKVGIPKGMTFYNNVIAGCYYSIFYAAKAYLISKDRYTRAPEEHKKTYEAFRSMVVAGILSEELKSIYDEESVKADELLGIFFYEKRNRGRFTYSLNSEANMPFAEQSLYNARTFLSAIKIILS
ncbi:MAG: hypothetical protein ACMXYL_04265 [Candidatus Woesearchaeota archaeon]